MKNKSKQRKGSVLVYVLLLMFLMLTIGLNIMSSSIHDQKSSVTEDKSNMSFSMAELATEQVKIYSLSGLKTGDYLLSSILGWGTPCISGEIRFGSNVEYYADLEFFNKDGDPITDCDTPIIDVKRIESTGRYKDSYRTISSPFSFDFHEKGLLGYWKPEEKNSPPFPLIHNSSPVFDEDDDYRGELNGDVVFDPSHIPLGSISSWDILDFGPGNGYVQVNDLAEYARDGDIQEITLSAWINKNANSNSYVVSLGDSVILQLLPNGRPRGSFRRNSSNAFYNVTCPLADQITLSNWHMLTYTYEDGEQKIYLDGDLCAEASRNVPITYNGSIDNLTIGSNADFSGNFFGEGMMREIRLYDRVLGEGEVRMLHNATRASF